MNRLIILTLLILSVGSLCQAQLRIEDCYEKAEQNYPLIRQYALIEKTKDYNLANAAKGYLPQIALSGKASYQSEVTTIPVDIPGVGKLNKDQYSLTLDVNQVIWDGGNIASNKEAIQSQAQVSERETDVSLYAVREQVNQLFFGILYHDAMIRQSQLLQQELQRNIEKVTAYITNGVANQSDRDAIQVELLKARQNEKKLTHDRGAYTSALGLLIGEELAGTTFIKPEKIRTSGEAILRPELQLYDAMLQKQSAEQQRIQAGSMPRLSLFVTGGYGRPSLNMLDNDFTPYYIGGIRLSWNLSSFYTKSNELKASKANESAIELQRETFLFRTRIDADQREQAIRKYADLLASDDEIIRLRNAVKQSAEAKLANGTLSTLDLMKEVDAEQQAIQEKILHEIELLQAIYNLKYTTNN